MKSGAVAEWPRQTVVWCPGSGIRIVSRRNVRAATLP